VSGPEASASHHLALRVADIERASRFYVEAFGARVLTAPYRRYGPEAETTWGGLGGVDYLVSHLAIGAGAVELFEFRSPADLPPAPPLDPAAGLLHFGIRVDDVDDALAAVERAGGRRLWPEVRRMGPGVSVVYVADPDDNVIELSDAGIESIAELVIAAYPEARPAGPGSS
jgi:catechol 2,3-dioxygenase-like lactoylglutathione lyase family enzyme